MSPLRPSLAPILYVSSFTSPPSSLSIVATQLIVELLYCFDWITWTPRPTLPPCIVSFLPSPPTHISRPQNRPCGRPPSRSSQQILNLLPSTFNEDCSFQVSKCLETPHILLLQETFCRCRHHLAVLGNGSISSTIFLTRLAALNLDNG